MYIFVESKRESVEKYEREKGMAMYSLVPSPCFRTPEKSLVKSIEFWFQYM